MICSGLAPNAADIILVDITPACSAFTRVAARTLAPSPIRDLLHRRLQPLRHLHDCSGCFRLERLPGEARTHWKAPPSHGAHVERTLWIARVRRKGGKRGAVLNRSCGNPNKKGDCAMTGSQWLLMATCALSFYGVGQVWLVQLSAYPLWT